MFQRKGDSGLPCGQPLWIPQIFTMSWIWSVPVRSERKTETRLKRYFGQSFFLRQRRIPSCVTLSKAPLMSKSRHPIFALWEKPYSILETSSCRAEIFERLFRNPCWRELNQLLAPEWCSKRRWIIFSRIFPRVERRQIGRKEETDS